MEAFWWYIRNLACSLDQVGNALFGGWCDETISSHLYRLNRDSKPLGILMYAVDLLFCWQDVGPEATGHCHFSYLSEVHRRDCPPEMRPWRT